MISDLHVHTNFCDGKNSPEEMVMSAIEKGVDKLGIVCHAHMPFRADWAVKKAKIKPFQDEIYRLKEKYKDKIDVLCGTELDLFSDIDTSGFEFTIGSVHYFYKDGIYRNVDLGETDFIDVVKTLFNGDVYSAIENYYEILSGYETKFHPTFIGHFDLVRKFNKGEKLFDESHPRYLKAMENAMDKLMTLNVPFEINTGAISRGYQDNPYPSARAIDLIKKKGGTFILNSDSHSVENIAYQFDKWGYLL